MMDMHIDNCSRCGKIHVKNRQNLCNECIKIVEEQYQTCVKYLREHQQASIYELSEATGVSVSQITKFILEGRISTASAPGLSYPCELCGKLINTNKLCDSCRTRLQQGWKKETKSEHTDKNSTSGKSVYEIKQWD